VHAAQGVVGLAADRLHLLRLGREIQREHLVARRLIPVAAVVDRVREPGLVQRHRGISHHRRALRDAGKHRLARGIEITDDLDTEPVLLQRRHGRLQRVLVRQRDEAVRDGSRAHCWSSLMQIAPGNRGSR
jgi:hypothetical protein